VVKVVGLSLLVPGPHRSAEHGDPVVGWLPDAVDHLAGVPHVEVLVLLFAGYRADEPVALVARVVGHKVQDDLDVQLLGAGYQRLEILHGSEEGIDALQISHIVAKVSHGRGEDRGQPGGGNADFLQVGQLLRNT